ncbi:MAG TPA: hypothetical protein VN901_21900 [Candidatus Acidoferrales bacterium]|nr:hypothetical protein [Candidatus Acidoferrales bacterium]
MAATNPMHPRATNETGIDLRYEHDSARRVNGYAAPQLHTHVVIRRIFFSQKQTVLEDVDDGFPTPVNWGQGLKPVPNTLPLN